MRVRLDVERILTRIYHTQEYADYLKHIQVLLAIFDTTGNPIKGPEFNTLFRKATYQIRSVDEFFPNCDYEHLICNILTCEEIKIGAKASLCLHFLLITYERDNETRRSIWQKQVFALLNNSIQIHSAVYNKIVRHILTCCFERSMAVTNKLVYMRESCNLFRTYIMQVKDSYCEYVLTIGDANNEEVSKFFIDPILTQIFSFPNETDLFIDMLKTSTPKSELAMMTQSLIPEIEKCINDGIFSFTIKNVLKAQSLRRQILERESKWKKSGLE